MQHKTRWIVVGAISIVVVAGGATWAFAAGGDDDQPLTGTTLERAADAALAYTGEGTVIETEAGDDGAAYGVEVRLDNGDVVEVALDADYSVIHAVSDDDGAADTEGDD